MRLFLFLIQVFLIFVLVPVIGSEEFRSLHLGNSLQRYTFGALLNRSGRSSGSSGTCVVALLGRLHYHRGPKDRCLGPTQETCEGRGGGDRGVVALMKEVLFSTVVTTDIGKRKE